ncbi:NAD(P)/FAD-dependent oxidoreductase [Ancylobacter dichloromethanicus]|uniref:Thioredoxin reductase n=1 Tax=Ancylobacter dichloromethanicus TaxID=518825 RepID=A0A9W6N1E9_9HYPH|nr:NAD(P)/FAD-dependent oxidoreductase [Ancylobacter dichloromethanicus]MBS7552343.1 NAD(P)/FAD-dependent oxidoreductase [Ancylobacter dichloromethanicus]GLK74080.1 thioredoxin reductase [Ancylobacter dichloromethanicus]
MHDVIVVGGSYAGMAAALQLLRARRRVLVIDAGQRRNRFSHAAHGFLGQDGVDPGEIARTARRQLEAYPTLQWVEGTAQGAAGAKDAFSVATASGVHHGRRLLFALGVSDELPAIAGLAERWGRSVFHCPYCDGYELERGRIGVLATGPMSVHQARMAHEWGAVTLFANGAFVPDGATRAELAAHAIALEETPVARLEGRARVVLADGRRLDFAGLFTAPRNRPASPVAQDLGCALAESPFGTQVHTDEMKETSVPGAYACGDAARAPHSVTLAVADGAWAGMQLHRSLVF